jgi:hypothetical protein
MIPRCGDYGPSQARMHSQLLSGISTMSKLKAVSSGSVELVERDDAD